MVECGMWITNGGMWMAGGEMWMTGGGIWMTGDGGMWMAGGGMWMTDGGVGVVACRMLGPAEDPAGTAATGAHGGQRCCPARRHQTTAGDDAG